jgi:hypothetical protein
MKKLGITNGNNLIEKDARKIHYRLLEAYKNQSFGGMIDSLKQYGILFIDYYYVLLPSLSVNASRMPKNRLGRRKGGGSSKSASNKNIPYSKKDSKEASKKQLKLDRKPFNDDNNDQNKKQHRSLITNKPPLVVNPLKNQTVYHNELFEMMIPIETFQDADGNQLTLSITQVDWSPLPSWLNIISDPIYSMLVDGDH